MSITTPSSHAFNQDASMARNAAKDGPVIITDRGRPPRVLLTVDDYKKLTGERTNIADLLAMPDAAGAGAVDFELTIPPMPELAQSADLS